MRDPGEGPFERVVAGRDVSTTSFFLPQLLRKEASQWKEKSARIMSGCEYPIRPGVLKRLSLVLPTARRRGPLARSLE